MKKLFKIIGIFLIIIVVGAIGFVIYFNSHFPKVSAATEIKIQITPERLARGSYLANHVTGCIDCHSKRDFSKYAGPVIPGTEGMGGEKFDDDFGNIPGVVYSKNITPAGLGTWTDGEILRAITVGVNKDGEALFPLMQYKHFRNLCREDLYSVIAYIRSLKPIENKVPPRNLNFPVNLLVKLSPSDVNQPFPPMPDKANTVAYGAYMMNAVSCIECHTKLEKGEVVPGREFAGGFRFCINGKCANSANITPDQSTGIGALSKEDFIKKFTFYRDSATQNIPVGIGGNNTPMPWTFLSGMNDDDLSAIYAYLRTVAPITNKVEKFTLKN